MRFIKFTFLSFLLIAFTVTSLDAQVKIRRKKMKAPMLTVELLSSYNLPLQETKGEIADFFQFKNYGTSVGFGGQLNFKLAVDKYGAMRPYLTLGYSQFQNDDPNYAYIDLNNIVNGYPLLNNQQFNKVQGVSDLFIRDAFAGLGFEYAFTRAEKSRRFIPFVGLDLNLHVLWGLYRQTPTQFVSGQLNSGSQISYTIKSGVRFGLGVGAGAQYRLAEPFGLGLGIKYRIANLIGKDSKRTKTKLEDPNDENKMEFLDKGDGSISSLLSTDRNVGYMEFYFGFFFYIGKKK